MTIASNISLSFDRQSTASHGHSFSISPVAAVQAGNVPETDLCMIKIRFFQEISCKISEKKWHFSLPPPPFASSRSCRRQGGCQQLLYGADPSTHSISPHFLHLLLPSSLHCPFNQLPSPPSSSSMILFALPRPYFPSPHMLVATQLFFSLWSCLSFFPSSRGQTSPTNPSTCKSARLARISRLDGEIYDPENAEQRGKRD